MIEVAWANEFTFLKALAFEEIINAKVKSIYDHGNIDIPTNSESAVITKSDDKEQSDKL